MDVHDLVEEFAGLLRNLPTRAGDYGDAVVYDDGAGNLIARAFVGTVMSLDPCGRFHPLLAPSSPTEDCEAFWADLEDDLNARGIALMAGEGDPCDLFVEREILGLIT